MAVRKLPTHRPTIKEVAKEAGVSFRTVARVANNEPVVSDGLKKRVRDAMEKLGYRPNIAARQLRSQRSFMIALIFYDAPAELPAATIFFAAAHSGANRRCRESGFTLLVEGYTPESGRDIAKRLLNANIDGAIILPPVSQAPEFLAQLEKNHIRYALISPDSKNNKAPVIASDDEEAACAMTKNLICLGHRRIAYIGARNRLASKLRREGYCRALTEAGIPLCEDYEAIGDFSSRTGQECGEALLRLKDRPTAIFCANDSIAQGAMVAAVKLGVSVPEDLSIAGYDDTLTATSVWPQLTTVHQPIADMAASAVDLLANPELFRKTQKLVLEATLVRRGTTAKCNTP